MVEDLERDKNPAEIAEVASEKEITELSSMETKPTLGRTYTEEEFGKAQSSWDRQIALSKAEVAQIKAEREQFKAEQEFHKAEIKELQGEFDKLVVGLDDPDQKEKILSRISIARERQALARERAENQREKYEAQKMVASARLGLKAQELMQDTGIPLRELESCPTEQEMEIKALRFQLGQAEPKETKIPKIDSGISSGSSEGIPLEREKFITWLNGLPPGEYERKWISKVNTLRKQGKIK